jgi:hypothetical protein
MSEGVRKRHHLSILMPGNKGNKVGQQYGNKYKEKRRVWQQIKENKLLYY